MTYHPFKPWFDLAHARVPALTATAAIAAERERLAQDHAQVRSYEVVVPENPPALAPFLAETCGRLRHHLASLGLPTAGTPAVFLSVFCGADLHFIGSVETLALETRLRPPLALPG